MLAAVGLHDVEDVAAMHVVVFACGGGVALEGGEDGVGERRGDGEDLELVFWMGFSMVRRVNGGG